MALTKLQRRNRIKNRIRKIVSGTAAKPRLSVFRSNKEISAQLINDVTGVTLASTSSLTLKNAKGSKVEVATEVGKALAGQAAKAGIQNVAFDRNGYLYHGRVKALADGAREEGLKF
jgi:large subunit ribosomal protein L18